MSDRSGVNGVVRTVFTAPTSVGWIGLMVAYDYVNDRYLRETKVGGDVEAHTLNPSFETPAKAAALTTDNNRRLQRPMVVPPCHITSQTSIHPLQTPSPHSPPPSTYSPTTS